MRKTPDVNTAGCGHGNTHMHTHSVTNTNNHTTVYDTILHFWYCTVLCNTILHYITTLLYCIVIYYTIIYYTVLYLDFGVCWDETNCTTVLVLSALRHGVILVKI